MHRGRSENPAYIRRLWLQNVYRERTRGGFTNVNIDKKVAAQEPKPVPAQQLVMKEEIKDVPFGKRLSITISSYDSYSAAAFNDFFERYSVVYHLRRKSKKISFTLLKHMVKEFGYDLTQPKN